MKAILNPRAFVEDTLAKAEINVGGANAWDIRVTDDRFYDHIVLRGSLALGESYMDDWWTCGDLAQFFTRIFRGRIEDTVNPWTYLALNMKARLFNRQAKSRVFSSGGATHYDLNNEFYGAMLGSHMVYTCGYWKEAKDLESAQEAKLKLVCEKIGLKPGMTVLDVGCGWGGFLRFAAEKYGACGTGITISRAQAALAKERCKGLDVRIELKDYREARGRFDRVISLGMLEHVGHKNYRAFMQTMAACLAPDGLFLLHTIGGNRSEVSNDPWIDKHIFPGSMLPSITQLGSAIEGLFIMEDWHCFGSDYDKTLCAWFDNFDRRWTEFRDKLGPVFYRKWKYYLLSCAGSFRARKNQLWQLVLSPAGVAGGYQSVR